MLGRLVTGLMLKAALSLAVLLGIASYAQYLAGGDPGALWRGVAGGAADTLARSIDGVGERVGEPLRAVGAGGGDGGATRVWTWRDADGVAHYASAPPPGVDARAVAIDPDVNLIAAPPASARAPMPAGTSDGSGDDVALPGIGGALRRVPGGAQAPDAERAERLLQALGGASTR